MIRLFLLAAGLTAMACSVVRAAPLDAATCGLLRGEQVQLEQSGVRDSMAKGPEWAKAKLSAEKLDQVRRLLYLDEQILFRCSGRNLIELPPEADAEPAAPPDEKDAPAGKDAGKDKAAAKKPATVEKKPASAEKAAPKSPSEEAAAAQPPAKKQAAPKDAGGEPAKKAGVVAPKPKTKVDDAYKPPPGNPQADPFAKQLQK